MDHGSAEKPADDGAALVRFGHRHPKVFRRQVHGPEYVEDDGSASTVATGLTEARGQGGSRPESGTGSVPEAPALRVNAEGEIDRRHRRIKEAQEAVAAARETSPDSQPSSSDELFIDELAA